MFMEETLIQRLIEKKSEGEFWDYKQKWYEANADMLHDIICMANNLANRDAYIIIGVSDNGEILGVPKENRKNQENVITFLRNVSFEGSIRPTVRVQTMIIGGKEIDVIEIKNTINTPYYLNKDYDKDKTKNNNIVRRFYIYTRVGDTNTPKNESADLDKVEMLWKKRFGLTYTVKERLLSLLDNLDDWIFETEYEGYNSKLPEFQIHISESDYDDLKKMPERILFIDSNYCVQRIELLYNNTIIFRTDLHNYDGGKISLPGYDFVKTNYKGLSAPCYIMSDFSGKLLKMWTDPTEREYALRGNSYIRNYTEVLKYYFLIFENEEEKIAFEEFIQSEPIEPDYFESENVKFWTNKINEHNAKTQNNGIIAEDYIVAMLYAKEKYDSWKANS